MLKDTVQLGTGIEKDSRGQKSLDNTSTGSSTVSSLRGVSRSKVAGVLAMLTALSGVRCTLNTMGEGKPLDDAMVTDCGDANQEKGTGGTGGTVTPWPEAGDEDVKDGGVIDVAVDVPNDCPDSTVDGDAGVDVLEEVDAAGEDVVIDVADEDVAQDVSEEPDVSDAPEDVAEEDAGPKYEAGVTAIEYDPGMGCYKVMYLMNNYTVVPNFSSSNDNLCQQDQIITTGILPNDIVELWVNGSNMYDAGLNIDISQARFDLFNNIYPVKVEGRCSMYSFPPDRSQMATEYNNSAGFVNLASFPAQDCGQLCKSYVYGIDQSCNAKVYKIYF